MAGCLYVVISWYGSDSRSLVFPSKTASFPRCMSWRSRSSASSEKMVVFTFRLPPLHVLTWLRFPELHFTNGFAWFACTAGDLQSRVIFFVSLVAAMFACLVAVRALTRSNCLECIRELNDKTTCVSHGNMISSLVTKFE